MRAIHGVLILAASLLMAACGGGGGSGGGTSASYTIGGAASGVSGAGLVLRDNGGDNLSVSSNGAFTFQTTLVNGAAYAVTVGTQPSNQTCTISNGSGIVSGANVTNIAVSCTSNRYTIGGSVSGLTGTGLVLQDNGGDNLSVSSNGAFTFQTTLVNGATYAATVGTQPSNQTCTISNGSGIVSGANVTNIAVSCSSNRYTIGGSVSGVTGTGLVLQDNGGDNLSVSSNGAFTFQTTLGNGAAYAVTVLTPPSTESCTVINGSGMVSGANVANVSVSCSSSQHTIGGAVSGLSGSGLVLQDNGGDNLPVAANGTFTFATELTTGQAYAVTVLTQPSTPAQYCTVASAAGMVGAGNIVNVAITCRTTGQYLYVTTTFGGPTGVVSLFEIDPATGLLSRDSRYKTTGVQPFGITLDTQGYAYVAYQDSSAIETILADGNPLVIANYSYVHNSSNTSTFALAMDPTAAYLFAGGSSTGTQGCANSGAGVLFNYSVASGVLTSLSSGYALDGNPCSMVTDPQGKFLFVPLEHAGEIVVFSINSDGSLTELNGGAPYTFQGGAGVNTPYAVAMDATASYLLFVDSAANTVSVYSYDPVTAAITQIGSPYPVGATPEGVAVDPTGQFVYVANSGAGTISAFTINAAGGLTAITGSPFDTGQGSSTTPTGVTVEPSGQYLYVANGDAATLSIFSIDPGTGTLTAVGTAPTCPNGATCTVGGYGGTGASVMAIQ